MAREFLRKLSWPLACSARTSQIGVMAGAIPRRRVSDEHARVPLNLGKLKSCCGRITRRPQATLRKFHPRPALGDQFVWRLTTPIPEVSVQSAIENLQSQMSLF